LRPGRKRITDQLPVTSAACFDQTGTLPEIKATFWGRPARDRRLVRRLVWFGNQNDAAHAGADFIVRGMAEACRRGRCID